MEWINQRGIFKKSLKLLLFHSEGREGGREGGRERQKERERMEVKPREQTKGLGGVAPTTEYGHLALQHNQCVFAANL